MSQDQPRSEVGAAGTAPGPRDELRMNGYYITFKPTGVYEIDRILSAVAVAGKFAHSTEGWSGGAETESDWYRPDYLRGSSPEEWIQNAADDARASLERVTGELAEAQRRANAVEYDAEHYNEMEVERDRLLRENAALADGGARWAQNAEHFRRGLAEAQEHIATLRDALAQLHGAAKVLRIVGPGVDNDFAVLREKVDFASNVLRLSAASKPVGPATGVK